MDSKVNKVRLIANKLLLGKLLKSAFKVILYSLLLNQKEKEKYKYRFLGIFNSILNRPSSFRDKI